MYKSLKSQFSLIICNSRRLSFRLLKTCSLAGVLFLTSTAQVAAAENIVFDQGSTGSAWNNGINAFDSAIDYGTCSNDGGAACPSISWGIVTDNERGNVLQVSHSASGSPAGLYIGSTTGRNLTAYAGGNVIFDIKVVSGNSNITMKIDCIWPCTSGDRLLGSKGASGWQTVTVSVDDLVAGGLNLSQIDTGLAIWATNATSTIFRIDNVRWEDSGSTGGTGGTGGTDGGSAGITAIDSSKWFHQTQLPSGGSWYNNEQQHYTNRIENSYVSDGSLKIVAKRESFPNQGHTKQFTSARLNSKYAFTYGRVVVRAKLPSGAGTWPAIWTLGKNINEPGAYWQTQGFGNTNWPACGEIDIMEHWGTNQNFVQSAMHTPSSFGGTFNHGGQVISNASTAFNNYEMDWQQDRIIFSVNGNVHYTYAPAVRNSETWPYDKEQYLLLNVAIQTSIGASYSQSAMEIDYVRIYAEDGSLSFSDEFNTSGIADNDNDGIADDLDSDDDNDGVPDTQDAFPFDSTEAVDTDGDDLGNNADPDDDNDGVADQSDAFPLNPGETLDTDGDDLGNNADPDDDNDGIADSLDAFSLDVTESIDTDNDGTGDNADNDDDGDGIYDSFDSYPLDLSNQPQKALDIDGNGQIEAFTDVLLILRYSLGFTGNSLIDGVVAEDATRSDAAAIEDYLDSLIPQF